MVVDQQVTAVSDFSFLMALTFHVVNYLSILFFLVDASKMAYKNSFHTVKIEHHPQSI